MTECRFHALCTAVRDKEGQSVFVPDTRCNADVQQSVEQNSGLAALASLPLAAGEPHKQTQRQRQPARASRRRDRFHGDHFVGIEAGRPWRDLKGRATTGGGTLECTPNRPKSCYRNPSMRIQPQFRNAVAKASVISLQQMVCYRG